MTLARLILAVHGIWITQLNALKLVLTAESQVMQLCKELNPATGAAESGVERQESLGAEGCSKPTPISLSRQTAAQHTTLNLIKRLCTETRIRL